MQIRVKRIGVHGGYGFAMLPGNTEIAAGGSVGSQGFGLRICKSLRLEKLREPVGRGEFKSVRQLFY